MGHGDDRARGHSASPGKREGGERGRGPNSWEVSGKRSRDDSRRRESGLDEDGGVNAQRRGHRRAEQDLGRRRAFADKGERQHRRQSSSLEYSGRRSEHEERKGGTDRRERGFRKFDWGESRRSEKEESWWKRRDHDERRGEGGHGGGAEKEKSRAV